MRHPGVSGLKLKRLLRTRENLVRVRVKLGSYGRKTPEQAYRVWGANRDELERNQVITNH